MPEYINYIATASDLTSIADAIRAKTGDSSALSFPSDFISAIGSISGEATLVTKTVVANGTYNAADDSADGYSSVTVIIPSQLTISDVSNATGITAVIMG